jgi:2-polyprenyl-6-methoxyphenol hydroxylase-like FAD-dependent oxidoreductase
MHHQKVRRVLIAGGGIGGLIAAIALQRKGIAVSVFERVKELAGVGAGLTLWANALKALHKIELTDMFERKALWQ